MRSWRANRWRSQARTLWQRYRDVAELGDEHEGYARLKEFLDSFRTQYQEVSAMGDNSETMDRLYGDCTEVLHSLIDQILCPLLGFINGIINQDKWQYLSQPAVSPVNLSR